jgi:hypothetical protein
VLSYLVELHDVRVPQPGDNLPLGEAKHDFGSAFVERARSVYHLNDERGRLKRRINELCGSVLVERKVYTEYSSR